MSAMTRLLCACHEVAWKFRIARSVYSSLVGCQLMGCWLMTILLNLVGGLVWKGASSSGPVRKRSICPKIYVALGVRVTVELLYVVLQSAIGRRALMIYRCTHSVGSDLSVTPGLRPRHANVRVFQGNIATQDPTEWKANDGGSPLPQDEHFFRLCLQSPSHTRHERLAAIHQERVPSLEARRPGRSP
jgi:hypothetical protein